jgi:hypothetical protein
MGIVKIKQRRKLMERFPASLARDSDAVGRSPVRRTGEIEALQILDRSRSVDSKGNRRLSTRVEAADGKDNGILRIRRKSEPEAVCCLLIVTSDNR